MLSGLPIPSYLVFAIMFFFGSFISGSTAIVAIGAPLAFAVYRVRSSLFIKNEMLLVLMRRLLFQFHAAVPGFTDAVGDGVVVER